MCKHGDTVRVCVPGPDGWDFQEIDHCIARLVNALNKADIYTASSCCGHGEELGHIWLQDGRALIVLPEAMKETISVMVRKAEK
jgi:hypothetical protein